jgi:hypothetical protein
VIGSSNAVVNIVSLSHLKHVVRRYRTMQTFERQFTAPSSLSRRVFAFVRIWPSRASAQRRAARFTKIALYSEHSSKPMVQASRIQMRCRSQNRVGGFDYLSGT